MEEGAPHETVSGVLLIDKPSGPSSNAVLQRTKGLLGATRAGHTGTLDPLASGLLVVVTGEATKFSGAMLDADKAYRARLRLGERTTTGDAEGTVLARSQGMPARGDLLDILDRFRGEIEQVPPAHSAIKHLGRPLYAYARKGVSVLRSPRRIAIRRLELESLEGNIAVLRVECSKGTYIRTLAEDIGEALGCGAHVAALERTAVGRFRLDQAIALHTLEELSLEARRHRLLPAETLVSDRPRLTIGTQTAAKFRQGQALPVDHPGGDVAIFDEEGSFLGIGEIDLSGTLRPKRLMARR
jgi:tRNA pseudouridine55 synthase